MASGTCCGPRSTASAVEEELSAARRADLGVVCGTIVSNRSGAAVGAAAHVVWQRKADTAQHKTTHCLVELIARNTQIAAALATHADPARHDSSTVLR